MPGSSAIADLTSDPVAFLSNNIMTISGKLSGLGTQGGVQPLTLRPYSYAVGRKGASVVNVYTLCHLRDYPDAEQFDAYWCPYQQNSSGTATLHGRLGPSLAFTPLMDGCTFAAGAPAADGSRFVTHVNMASQAAGAGGAADQRRLQRNVASGTVGSGAGTVINEPASYFGYAVPGDMTSKLITVTFGVRTGSNWSFYQHQYYGSKDETNARSMNWAGCGPVTATV